MEENFTLIYFFFFPVNFTDSVQFFISWGFLKMKMVAAHSSSNLYIVKCASVYFMCE